MEEIGCCFQRCGDCLVKQQKNVIENVTKKKPQCTQIDKCVLISAFSLDNGENEETHAELMFITLDEYERVAPSHNKLCRAYDLFGIPEEEGEYVSISKWSPL